MVNCLLAGFEGDEPRLYWHDYLGSVVELNKAAHGYAEYFVSSTMDTLETKVISPGKFSRYVGRVECQWSCQWLLIWIDHRVRRVAILSP